MLHCPYMKRLMTLAILVIYGAMPSLVHAQATLPNPLGTTDIRVIVAQVVRGFLTITGPIALIMFIYGGVIWMTSTGTPARIDKGKKVLVWAVLGLVVIFSAFVITNAIFNAILEGNVAGA